MPTDPRSCRIEILTQTEHCTVGYCRRCNLFHVDLGAISLRLHTVQLHAVGGSLNQALEVFKRQILMEHTPAMRESENPVH